MTELKKSYFSILKCKTCQSIPNKKDLDTSGSMEQFKDLVYAFSESYKSDRYYDHTEMILKCPICSTHYHHYYSIDTEDAFVGGPSITENLQRLNLVRLKEMLAGLGKNEALSELNQSYAFIIDEFKNLIREKRDIIQPNILPYVIESLTDYYINENDWTGLYENLLSHSNHEIALDTLYDLIIMFGQKDSGGIYPSFTYYKNISPAFHKIYLPFFTMHKQEILKTINKFKSDANPEIKVKYNSIMNSVKYYKISS